MFTRTKGVDTLRGLKLNLQPNDSYDPQFSRIGFELGQSNEYKDNADSTLVLVFENMHFCLNNL